MERYTRNSWRRSTQQIDPSYYFPAYQYQLIPSKYYAASQAYIIPATLPTQVPVVYRTPISSTSNRSRANNRYGSEDDDDLPLSRSQLNSCSCQCSCSMTSSAMYHNVIYAPQLNASLDRLEKATNRLRQKSRSMYRSLRDTVYKTELSCHGP